MPCGACCAWHLQAVQRCLRRFSVLFLCVCVGGWGALFACFASLLSSVIFTSNKAATALVMAVTMPWCCDVFRSRCNVVLLANKLSWAVCKST